MLFTLPESGPEDFAGLGASLETSSEVTESNENRLEGAWDGGRNSPNIAPVSPRPTPPSAKVSRGSSP